MFSAGCYCFRTQSQPSPVSPLVNPQRKYDRHRGKHAGRGELNANIPLHTNKLILVPIKGGQIVRIALACSALTGQPVKISNIRAGRKKGGLAAQHLKGVELLRDICQANVRGATLGSMEVEFTPGFCKGGNFVADTKTAGFVVYA